MPRIKIFYLFWLSVICTFNKLHAKHESCYSPYNSGSRHTILNHRDVNILAKLDAESSIMQSEEIIVVFTPKNSNTKISVPFEETNAANLLNTFVSKRITFIEYPAFYQNMSSTEDFISKYYIWSIFRQARAVKFLLKVSSPDANSHIINVTEFVHLINTISSFLTKFQKFKDSFALVVTDVKNNKNVDITTLKLKVVEILEKICVANQKYNNTRGFKIIQSLTELNNKGEYSKIDIILKPNERNVATEIHFSELSERFDEVMLKKNIKFVRIHEDDFSYSYYPHTFTKLPTSFVTDQLERLIQERIMIQRCIIIAEILEYFQNYETKITDIQALEEFFKISLNNITQLEKSISQNPNSETVDINLDKKVLKELVQFTRFMGIENQKYIHILDSYKYLKFIEIYKSSKVKSFLSSWEINVVKKFIEDSDKWYSLLNYLYLMFSDYVVQKNRFQKVFNIQQLDDACTKKSNLNNLEVGLALFEETFKQYKNDESGKYLTFKNANSRDVEEIEIEFQQLDVHHLNETHEMEENRRFQNLENVDINELKLHHLCKVYDQTILEELQYNCFDHTLQIKQHFISFDQIPPKDFCNGGIKRLELFAFDTIFVNEDLIRVGEELEVVAIAPKWIIYGNRKIVLDGIDGKEHERPKAQDSFTPGFDGEDGLPGFPGGPAGTFLGIGSQVTRIIDSLVERSNSQSIQNTLIISANGGNGGKGQDGGNGAKGKDGLKGMRILEEEYRLSVGRGFLPDDMKPCHLETGISNSYYCVPINGSPGFANGEGGEGGKGGLPGLAGDVHIFLPPNSDILLQKSSKVGINGKGGVGGMGGYGSKDGQSYYDVYSRKYTPAHGRYHSSDIYRKVNVTSAPETLLPKARDGMSNENEEGKENPESSPLPQFAQSLNKYKILLREQVSSGIEQKKLMDFYNILNEENSLEERINLSQFDDTLGLVNELQGLEEQFFKLSHVLDFLPFYKSLLKRIENYSKSPKLKEKNKDYKTVLIFLYTAVLSKICTFENKAYNYLIVDIRKELVFISENIQDILTATTKVSRNNINKQYKSDIDNKIKETTRFVNTIEGEIHKINKQLESEMKRLTNTTVAQETRATNKFDSDITRKEEIEKQVVMKRVFQVLKGISSVASFCGPWGSITAGLLETGEQYVKPFIMDKMTKDKTKDFVLKSSIDMIMSAKGHIESIADKLWSDQKEALKENIDYLKNKEKELPQLESTRVKLEEVVKGDPFSDESVLDQSERVISEEEENLNNAIKELKNGENAHEEKKRVLSSLNKLHQLNKVLKSGYDMSKSMMSKDEDIKRVQEEIDIDRDKAKKLDDFQNDIHLLMMPMLRSMRQQADDLEKNLATKSSVALDVTKWKVDETLTDIKVQLKKMTKDFPQISETFGNLVQKLIDTLNTLINVYEYMAKYQDRKVLVEYIAQINSPNLENLNVDENLIYAMSYLNVIIETNAILDPYVRTIKTFKQVVFPFAKYFMAEFSLPDDLDLNDVDNVRSNVIYKMKRLSNILERADYSIISRMDDHIHVGEFSTENTFSGPFYVWRNSEFRFQIDDLLSGKKVILGADINKGLEKNAVKFKTIQLKFIATNPSHQDYLDEILNDFQVTMVHSGNSYYRCGKNHYIITTSQQKFSYNLHENSKKYKLLETSLSYLKLQQGDFILSPYTVWEIQLQTRFDYSYLKLQGFRDQVNIALVGTGQYVDSESDICDSELHNYYKEDTKDTLPIDLFIDIEND